MIITLLFTTSPVTCGECSSWSCVSVHPSVCVSVRTHISLPTGQIFLILTMMMILTLSVIQDTDKIVCFCIRFPCYKDTQQQIHSVLLSPMFAHYIGVVLAGNKGLKWLVSQSIFLMKVNNNIYSGNLNHWIMQTLYTI